MGRGVSGRESISARAVRSVYAKNVRINLSDNPLVYAKNIKLPKPTREVIKDFESQYRDSDIEHACLVDKDGNIVAKADGTKGAVETLKSDWEKALVYTHTHTSEPGIIGGTFSETDFYPFIDNPNVITMRAATNEGTYSITRGKRFDGIRFQMYYHNERRPLRIALDAKVEALNRQALNGKISEDSYNAQFNKLHNDYLVKLHNILLAGQKKFGYTYGLERR